FTGCCLLASFEVFVAFAVLLSLLLLLFVVPALSDAATLDLGSGSGAVVDVDKTPVKIRASTTAAMNNEPIIMPIISGFLLLASFLFFERVNAVGLCTTKPSLSMFSLVLLES